MNLPAFALRHKPIVLGFANLKFRILAARGIQKNIEPGTEEQQRDAQNDGFVLQGEFRKIHILSSTSMKALIGSPSRR